MVVLGLVVFGVVVVVIVVFVVGLAVVVVSVVVVVGLAIIININYHFWYTCKLLNLILESSKSSKTYQHTHNLLLGIYVFLCKYHQIFY